MKKTTFDWNLTRSNVFKNLSAVHEVQVIYKRKPTAPDLTKVTNSRQAYELIRDYIYDAEREITDIEYFGAIYLDRQNKAYGYEIIHKGGLHACPVDVGQIFRCALLCRASSLILFHNHPSGNLRPSDADNRLTTQLREAGKLLNVHVIEHIIATDGGYYSYADNGEL